MKLRSLLGKLFDKNEHYKIIHILVDPNDKAEVHGLLMEYYANLLTAVGAITSSPWVLERNSDKKYYLRKINYMSDYAELIEKGLPHEEWYIEIGEHHPIRGDKIYLHAHVKKTEGVVRFRYSPKEPDIMEFY